MSTSTALTKTLSGKGAVKFPVAAIITLLLYSIIRLYIFFRPVNNYFGFAINASNILEIIAAIAPLVLAVCLIFKKFTPVAVTLFFLFVSEAILSGLDIYLIFNDTVITRSAEIIAETSAFDILTAVSALLIFIMSIIRLRSLKKLSVIWVIAAAICCVGINLVCADNYFSALGSLFYSLEFNNYTYASFDSVLGIITQICMPILMTASYFLLTLWLANPYKKATVNLN